MLTNLCMCGARRRWPWGYWNLHKLLSPFTTNTPKLTRLVLAGMSEKDRAVALAGDSSIQHFNQLVAEGTRQVGAVRWPEAHRARTCRKNAPRTRLF